MAVRPHRVLVVGGGFAGCAAAIALARDGLAVDIVEANPRWTTDGTGISVSGFTLRSLATLGVIDRFLDEGYSCEGTDVRDASGRTIRHLDSPRLVSPDLPGNGAIMRPALARILADAAIAAGATIRLGTSVADLADDGAGVDVTFTDGSSVRYGLVVGADGLYSAMRARILPDAPRPAFSGQAAWRAIVPRPKAMVRTSVWVGEGPRVGADPVSHDAAYLFVHEARTARDVVPTDEFVPRLRALLEGFSDPFLAGVRDALGEHSMVLFRPLDNLLVPRPWHSGRVVLIGDAVHATTPHLAAGAGIALEDALVLAEELRGADDLESALTAFADRRWTRCRLVVHNSARLGVLETRPGSQGEHTALMAASLRALRCRCSSASTPVRRMRSAGGRTWWTSRRVDRVASPRRRALRPGCVPRSRYFTKTSSLDVATEPTDAAPEVAEHIRHVPKAKPRTSPPVPSTPQPWRRMGTVPFSATIYPCQASDGERGRFLYPPSPDGAEERARDAAPSPAPVMPDDADPRPGDDSSPALAGDVQAGSGGSCNPGGRHPPPACWTRALWTPACRPAGRSVLA